MVLRRATAWRMVTKRRMSALLMLTMVGLSVRTAVAFASGSTFLYFLQPVLNNTVVALLFLLSLATGHRSWPGSPRASSR